MAITVPQTLSASAFISKKIILRFSDTIFIWINLVPSPRFLETLAATISQINLTMIYYRSEILFLFSSSLQFPRLERERGKFPRDTTEEDEIMDALCSLLQRAEKLGGPVAGRVEIGIEGSRSSNILWKRHIVRSSNTSHENGIGRKRGEI